MYFTRKLVDFWNQPPEFTNRFWQHHISRSVICRSAVTCVTYTSERMQVHAEFIYYINLHPDTINTVYTPVYQLHVYTHVRVSARVLANPRGYGDIRWEASCMFRLPNPVVVDKPGLGQSRLSPHQHADTSL